MLAEWTAALAEYEGRLDRLAGRGDPERRRATRVQRVVRLRHRRRHLESGLRALAMSPDPADHVWADRSIEDLGRAIHDLEIRAAG